MSKLTLHMFKQAPADLDFFGRPIFLAPFRVLFLSSFQVQAGAWVVVAGPAVVVGAAVTEESQETAVGFQLPSLPHLIEHRNTLINCSK